MNELIKVNYESERPTVMGRELHKALEVNSNYTTWFNRMSEYGFTEGVDFISCFPNLESENQHGGQNKIDHQLTIDMAKEICMIQRSEKGKQFRQYFIEVENKWNTPEAVMARALQFANNQLDSIKQQNVALTDTISRQNKIMTAWKPKVLFAQAVETAQTSILIGDLAKILKQNGISIGQKRLFDWLRNNGYLIKTGSSFNMPTQRAMELNFFEVKESTINNPDGSIRITKAPKVTGKGQEYFINKFLGNSKKGVKSKMTIEEFLADDKAKVEEIINKYPKQIPVPVLAEFMGMNYESLRAAIDGGALGLSWRKDGKLTKGYCVPTGKFVYWWFGQNPLKEVKQ